ncbi:MAG: BlaI/MecI/CopY family transcriptional regulator [Longibaculum sp.]
MQKLSDAELSVMEVLWSGHEFVLGELVDALKTKNQWSRNTVHTYLTRMEKKNLVKIDRNQEPHRYCYVLTKDDYLKGERSHLLNKVYQGSVTDLMSAFLKDSKITPEEKEKLNKILDEMEV